MREVGKKIEVKKAARTNYLIKTSWDEGLRNSLVWGREGRYSLVMGENARCFLLAGRVATIANNWKVKADKLNKAQMFSGEGD